jgi:formylglycine-generating enzyme required for sulfatase activity
MRKRFVLLMVALAAMAVAARGQDSPQGPPREFTNSVGMKFVPIDPGSFKMGGETDGPIHEVTLSRGFYLQATEVTQTQWEAVMGTNPSHFKGPDRPVESVSWNDIQEFLRKLNAREKDTRYRLPTEAEWEYACRVGGQEPDATPILGDVAWWLGNSGRETHPVGRKKPNAWGLYDMRGNVWEWVQDRYGPYAAERQVDPQGPPSGDYRVLRGGGWLSVQGDTASSYHSGVQPHERSDGLGFRCARTF